VTWLSLLTRENKKSFAIKRDETNTEPLSRVNGAPCRNCTPGFIVFRLRSKETMERKNVRERRKEKGMKGWKFSRHHRFALHSRDGQRSSKRFMSHFASIYLPKRQTFARKLPSRLSSWASPCYSLIRFYQHLRILTNVVSPFWKRD